MKGGEVAVDEINKAAASRAGRLSSLSRIPGYAARRVTAMRKLVQVDGCQVISTILTNVVTAQIPLAEHSRCRALANETRAARQDDLLLRPCADVGPDRPDDRARLEETRHQARVRNDAEQRARTARRPGLPRRCADIGAEYGEALLDTGTTDFRGVAERVIQFGAEAVVVPGHGGSVELNALRQLRELNTKALVYSLGQNYTSKSVIDAIGPYTEGMIFGGLYVSPSKAQKFVSAYKAKTGYVPSTQAEEQYDIIRMLALGIEKAGYNGEGIARSWPA